MGEIQQYFDELRSLIKSKPEVASVRTKSAQRKHPQFEERTFEVFLKSDYQSEVDRCKKELQENLQVTAETAPKNENAHIIITSTYDGNR